MKNRECKWIKYHEDYLWKAYVRDLVYKIPTKLLKEVLPTIIPALTKITNLSIENGVFSKNGNLQ